MRFQKGGYHPHPHRGPGRRKYHVSDLAHRARRQNLSRSRLRSDRETLVIKLLIWQSCFDGRPRPSQRTLARRLGVWPSYVYKVQKQSAEGLEILGKAQRASLDDLVEARRFTARLREQEPGLLRAVQSSREKLRAMTDDEAIAKNWREVNEREKSRLWQARLVPLVSCLAAKYGRIEASVLPQCGLCIPYPIQAPARAASLREIEIFK